MRAGPLSGVFGGAWPTSSGVLERRSPCCVPGLKPPGLGLLIGGQEPTLTVHEFLGRDRDGIRDDQAADISCYPQEKPNTVNVRKSPVQRTVN